MASTLDIRDINERARDVFRGLVEQYLATGEPVGSRTLARLGRFNLSPASIRNVMQDLEELGLLAAPHTSAGRVPTEVGLRLFVDGMMQMGELSTADREAIAARCRADGRSMEELLGEATGILSGLSSCAGLVMVPKADVAIRQLQFVPLGPQRALAILVGDDGSVENRVIELPLGLPAAALVQAGNYANARLAGLTLEQARERIDQELRAARAELDDLSARVVEKGLGVLASEAEDRPVLIVRGQSHLLDDRAAQHDLERVRQLLEDLESKKDLAKVLDLARSGQGIKVFIGSENKLFSLSGSSVIAAPYRSSDDKVVGVIGVIGPTRLNYARVVPMVDYTAKVLSGLIG